MINPSMLRESFHLLGRDAACGVDRVGVADSGKGARYASRTPREELAEEKSGVAKFSRFDVEGGGKFTFLGFDFYWARTRKGGRTVKRRTRALHRIG